MLPSELVDGEHRVAGAVKVGPVDARFVERASNERGCPPLARCGLGEIDAQLSQRTGRHGLRGPRRVPGCAVHYWVATFIAQPEVQSARIQHLCAGAVPQAAHDLVVPYGKHLGCRVDGLEFPRRALLLELDVALVAVFRIVARVLPSDADVAKPRERPGLGRRVFACGVAHEEDDQGGSDRLRPERVPPRQRRRLRGAAIAKDPMGLLAAGE